MLTNRAVALRRLDRPREALMSASRALVGQAGICPGAICRERRATDAGRFRAGWRGYEARWSVGLLASQRRDFHGAAVARRTESLDGKTILLTPSRVPATPSSSSRYAPLVAARGAKNHS